MLNVTFIHHSSFMVETDNHLLLFDYFPGEAVENMNFHGKLPELPADKKLYVFASHSHKDHFSVEVLKLQDIHPNITFILSKDIRLGRNYLVRNGIDPSIKSNIHWVKDVNTYHVDDLQIDTMRSTDAGVAFLVNVDGLNIFHAGDLNWWNAGDDRELYGNLIGKAYKKEINRLKNKHIDIAFVVLDGRVEDGYAFGMEYFLENIDVDLVFPMHMWQQWDLIPKLKRNPKLVNVVNKVIDIDRENIIFYNIM
ncbi:MAG: MBL fold metallo-hydrolase [Lachnospiraceae bacterium]|jgi:L-ascorbate metabolism protein UlaG (beta-lactamase superfamily)|nr:MBL fold metallo-hydrolase [Lachnospiraceae bacterium]